MKIPPLDGRGSVLSENARKKRSIYSTTYTFTEPLRRIAFTQAPRFIALRFRYVFFHLLAQSTTLQKLIYRIRSYELPYHSGRVS